MAAIMVVMMVVMMSTAPHHVYWTQTESAYTLLDRTPLPPKESNP